MEQSQVEKIHQPETLELLRMLIITVNKMNNTMDKMNNTMDKMNNTIDKMSKSI